MKKLLQFPNQSIWRYCSQTLNNTTKCLFWCVELWHHHQSLFRRFKPSKSDTIGSGCIVRLRLFLPFAPFNGFINIDQASEIFLKPSYINICSAKALVSSAMIMQIITRGLFPHCFYFSTKSMREHLSDNPLPSFRGSCENAGHLTQYSYFKQFSRSLLD